MIRILLVILLPFILIACDSKERPAGVQFPADYRQNFLKYAVIDRFDGIVRDIYISPDALSAAERGGSLPNGTIIVIEGYHAVENENGEFARAEQGQLVRDDGRPLEMIHIAEKRADWTDADFPNNIRIGNWNFGSYDILTGEKFDERLDTCFNCHQAAPQNDFIYTRRTLFLYARTQETQYVLCDLPGRIACENE